MRFALVVPALNEEEAIAATLRRALAARRQVVERTPVEAMTVVFVNDGSTDRTQDIVDQPEFAEVVKIRFEQNRGYGAAIKAGWQVTDADLLGFIDADGTCDPEFCVPLINRLLETHADVALAARLGPDSKMPWLRRFGNRLFARLLGAVSGQSLTDSASGFRVVRRRSLKLMSPLPDGLHFTPAMSSICLLDPRLRIEEAPMPYEERTGQSKLSVVKDGLRFLFTILFAACVYSPIHTFGLVSVIAVVIFMLFGGVAVAFGAWDTLGPLLSLAGAITILLLMGTGVLVHQLNFLLIGPRRQISRAERALQHVLYFKRLLLSGAAGLAAGLAGLVVMTVNNSQNIRSNLIIVLMLIAGLALMLGGVLMRTIWAVGQKQQALIHDEYRVAEPAGVDRPVEPVLDWNGGRSPPYKTGA